ncbi:MULTISPECIES: phytanoyl-CoA dioxygenase family protein [unclassified Streptomyces]|uniref:phytanoyl-CoA dioxygenase family protein n=1 Tax=unclassified Streptomyces TaxID=2593676 RepID=UPI002DDAD256|nr:MULTISPECIES: phytanoyl-CoA dioxygenase family protein [unclassified Streptomyces]WSA94663.1 phytanoyl-CoA dioxygenase family protein [Streptomyces sp. NBC_01795]WSB79082.1 phytanoyl-CoA dioxygenase family protein [Streptomyces sp. NBC_01775]WSS12717.1 phytanoyl-CoA dioxygenase family protein [Streptomyces sp. NBC_01186]WSS41500.1 phytanoyl-CoA dioxygenase family protein [Streptomyces sp. NBC_01187]
MRSLRDSSDVREDPDGLTGRLREDGYLYLPGALDPDRAEAVSADLRAALHGVGWLDEPGTTRVRSRDRKFTGESMSGGYAALQGVESFHALGHDQALLELTSGILGGPGFCHPARVGRVSFPEAGAGGFFTRPHQDFSVLHVTTDVLTTWIPFTACSDDHQGVCILPGSHREGYRRPDPTMGGARPLYVREEPEDPRWATADFQLGDIVVFHSLTVHGAMTNHSDRVRLSADFRYQLPTDPLRPEWLHPHGWPRTPDWPELTQGWSSQRWTEAPAEVPLIPAPEGLEYLEILDGLEPPRSRVLSGA